MIIDELLVALGYEHDDKEVKEFKKEIGDTVKIIGKLVKVAASGAAVLTGLTVSTTAAADEQGKLANEIGDTVENIDALQFASKRAGGTSEGLSASLQQLAIRASEAARGTGSGVEAFGILGISATDAQGKLKPTSELFLEISRNLEGLSKSKQIELADKLGVRDSIRLLQQGESGIQSLIREAQALGVTTGQDAAIAEQFQDGLVDLWQIVKEVSRTLTRELAPIMTDLIGQFTEWWKTNKDIFKQNLPEYLDKLTRIFKILAIAAASFVSVKVLSGLSSMLGLMKKLSIVSLATSGAVALIPALIAAIGLLAADAKAFFEGGENTLFGGLMEKFPEFQEDLNNTAAVMATIYDTTMLIVEGWKEIFALFDDFSFDKLKDTFDPTSTTSIFAYLDEVTGLNKVKTTLDPTDRRSIFAEIDEATGLNKLKNDITGFFSPEDVGKPSNNGGRIQHTKINGMTFYIRSTDPEGVANEINKRFQQTAEELETVVDQ